MIAAICKYNGQATTQTFEAYPGFMKYDAVSKTLVPLTDEPAAAATEIHSLRNIIRAFFRLKKVVDTLVDRLFDKAAERFEAAIPYADNFRIK